MVGPKTTRLIDVLDELVPVLRELELGHWADWMNESARRLRQGDFSGVGHLLSAYGGMGSFNDILPDLVGGQADDRIERARRLRADVWTLAEEIRHEIESG